MFDQNYWSVQRATTFEFQPTLRLIDLASVAGKNAVSGFLDKWKWREIRGTWNTSVGMTGEDFQLWQLAEEQGVTPFQYYLYGLGFGDGYRGRGFWNIVSGDGGLDSWNDYNGFAEYRNKRVDTTVYQNRFQNAVKRGLTASTGFTLPWWSIGVKGDLAWSQEFLQKR
jgi:hypothetical protein